MVIIFATYFLTNNWIFFQTNLLRTMNNTMFYILSFLLIVGGSWLISKFFACGGSSAPQFSVMDGEWKTKPVDAYSFGLNGATLNSSADVKKSLSAVATYLKDHPERSLNLNGTYYGLEKNTKITADNLGLARAEAVRKVLLGYKAPEESITVSSEKLNSITTSDKTLYNPVEFVFVEKKTDGLSDEESIGDGAGAVRSSVLDPYVIRFATGDNSISMTDELQSYLSEALAYLEGNEGSQLIVTGHTDNQGNASANKRLSKKRAQKVRSFLRKNGVASKQVVAEGMGDESPLEDNSTEEGRRMNRRVEITIR